MQSKTHIGLNAEKEAEKFLKKNGYHVLVRNFRIRGGEIDIVAIEGNTLVFVEVKARKSFQFGTPFESITSRKLQALHKTALFFKQKYPRTPDLMRMDAVAVMLGPGGKAISFELMRNIG